MISIHEYQRKAIHLFNLIIPFSYWFIIPNQNKFKIIIITFTALFILADYFRTKSKLIKKLFIIFFDKMLREHELKGQFTGATWVMISASVTILVFPKYIAIISLIFMSIGDTFAALIGRKFGKLKIYDKSFEGFLGGLIACLVVAYCYDPLPFYISGFGALAAMLFETLPLPLDDNFRIPIGSAIIMTMLVGVL
ncbi:MAG: hypothetical protein CMF90_00555 [Candidatus Marinimicrobia bacterium]|nr:hypothetical protein [Candidatus Neomarinimicrobiota bacterium]